MRSLFYLVFQFLEPAMLLMHNSIKTHPGITYGLLEFICKVLQFSYLFLLCFFKVFIDKVAEFGNVLQNSLPVFLWHCLLDDRIFFMILSCLFRYQRHISLTNKH